MEGAGEENQQTQTGVHAGVKHSDAELEVTACRVKWKSETSGLDLCSLQCLCETKEATRNRQIMAANSNVLPP